MAIRFRFGGGGASGVADDDAPGDEPDDGPGGFGASDFGDGVGDRTGDNGPFGPHTSWANHSFREMPSAFKNLVIGEGDE